MIEFLEIKNDAEYNPLSTSENAPFTQARIFGKWQEMMGRKVIRFEIRNHSEIIGFFQIIKYSLPFEQSFLYVPHNFIVTHDNKFLEEFYKKLFEIGKEEGAMFVRFNQFLRTENNFEKYFNSSTLLTIKKVPSYGYQSSYFQPKFEWILNLEKSEEEILNGMHPKTRYNIGLAERKGISIEIIGGNFEQYFNDFYKLLEQTAKRDSFGLHPKIYYRNIFETLNSENAFLAVARYDNNILLANLVLLYGNTAYFIFGGSSDEYKNLMAPHLAHWESIKESKNRGFKFYNFGGVDGGGNYGSYGGISIFKRRFGGELLEHSDSYDIVLKHAWYYLYNLRKWVLNLPLRGITRRVKK
ncbi:MAG: peptidoglycan bridge formation glycyltransferase FemA/FemB family protein [Candidatus Azambacteria bacterium]|nr:peptidoglycan bridge formation glycyltransferase FemA/FemB family protein [Candidatus Azambacteria bacterium]